MREKKPITVRVFIDTILKLKEQKKNKNKIEEIVNKALDRYFKEQPKSE
jgi:hypothetical protein